MSEIFVFKLFLYVRGIETFIKTSIADRNDMWNRFYMSLELLSFQLQHTLLSFPNSVTLHGVKHETKTEM